MTEYILFDPPAEGTTYLYRSSAGSGKTFTLTKAYLKLVLRDPSRYHQILAITFTNKAKDEMKSRIISELSKLANDENSEMRQQIVNDFKEEKVERIEDVITSRAQTVLSSLLHDYSRFNVSTIDHFFTHLIRHLAKELDLNLGYELDIDSQKALSESIEMLFSKADKRVLAWLQNFALDQIDNDQGWDIRKNIAELGKKLFHESYLDIEPALSENLPELDSFISQQKLIIKSFEEIIHSQAKRAIDIADQHNLSAADFKRNNPYATFAKLANPSYDLSIKPSQTFMDSFSLDFWHTKASERAEDISSARDVGMGDAHEKISELYSGEYYSNYLEAKAILQYIYSYGVLAALSSQVQEYRSKQNLIFISDSAFILNKAITSAETPFVYEKIGARYKYILIDEFQDTSTYQWKSLLPFFSNVIAEGGQLLIVGDVKQSIYGWRGGDMNLLLHQVEQDISVKSKDIRTLNTNYRSAKNIIHFNNRFFKIAAKELPLDLDLTDYAKEFELAYADVEQNTSKDYDGIVKVQFLMDTEDQSWMALAEQEVLMTIEAAVTDGFTYSDVLILTRTTKEAARIASFLLQNGVPALSESALKVSSSYKVQMVLSALKYMVDKKNILAVAEFNFFSQKAFDLSQISLQTPSDLLLEASKLKSRPLYEVVEELIIQFGLNTSPDIYLHHMLDITLNQVKKGTNSITSFLSWWQEQEDNNSQILNLSPPENDGAALVLTIHKAKGLEKPIVIIPYADFSLKPKNAIFWAHPMPTKYKAWGSLPLVFKQSLTDTTFLEAYNKHHFDTSIEALNLLYVAFTRAGERLYIFANGKLPKHSSSALIDVVINKEEFRSLGIYDPATSIFEIGIKDDKKASSKSQTFELKELTINSTPLSQRLVIDQSKSKMFMAIASEKSVKVKEGIILHLILAKLNSRDQLPEILSQLQNEHMIEANQKDGYLVKIDNLFNRIPEMTDWFSGQYEVLNERKIISGATTYIPDRVMVQTNTAIIVDYKREQKNDKHISQIKNYYKLLEAMGYTKIASYLLYIDDQDLVKVT